MTDSPSTSLLAQFTARLISESPSLPELAESLDSLIHSISPHPLAWALDFDNYALLTVDSYEQRMTARLECFSPFCDPPLLSYLDSHLSPSSVDFPSFVLRASALLSPARASGHGHLLLIGRFLLRFPALAAQLPIAADSVSAAGPVISWALSHALDSISPEALIRLFCTALVDPDARWAPLSVAAAHLIRRACRSPVRIRAALYIYLFEVCRRSATARDTHVAAVMLPLLSKSHLGLADIENLPRVFMGRYKATPPQQVLALFGGLAPKSRPFVAAWLRIHELRPEISQVYVKAVEAQLPPQLLARFRGVERAKKMAERRAAIKKRNFMATVVVGLAIVLGVVIIAAGYRTLRV